MHSVLSTQHICTLHSPLLLPPPPGGGVYCGHMERDKRDLLNRLKTVEGHIRGVQRMVEDDAYCIDIIKQTQAVQSALERFNSVILADHLNGCVVTAIRGDDAAEREKMVDELLGVFDMTHSISPKPKRRSGRA